MCKKASTLISVLAGERSEPGAEGSSDLLSAFCTGTSVCVGFRRFLLPPLRRGDRGGLPSALAHPCASAPAALLSKYRTREDPSLHYYRYIIAA